MALSAFYGVARTTAGTIIPSAAVEVRRAADNSLATIYEDAAGVTPINNGVDFVTDSSGVFEFYAEPDRYNVLVGSGASQVSIPAEIVDGRAQVPFESRADFVAWVASGGVAADGTVKSDGTVQYVASAGATAIADLPGWLPFGEAFFEHFGAKGDGVRGTDGFIAAGSNVFTDSGASFTSEDVGKLISIGGTNSTPPAPVVGVITGVTNSTTVTVSVSATATHNLGSTVYTYGSDSTSAFRAAEDYIATGGTVQAIGGKTYCINGRIDIVKRDQDNPHVNSHYREIKGNGSWLCQMMENEPMFVFYGATQNVTIQGWGLFYNAIQDAANTKSICITAIRNDNFVGSEASEVWNIYLRDLYFENCFNGIASWPDDTIQVGWWAYEFARLYGVQSRGAYIKLGVPTVEGTGVRSAIRDCTFFGWLSGGEPSIDLNKFNGTIQDVEVLRHQDIQTGEAAWRMRSPNGCTMINCRMEWNEVTGDGGTMLDITGPGDITIQGMDFGNLTGNAGAGNESYMVNNNGCTVTVLDPTFTGSVGVDVTSGSFYFLHQTVGGDDRGTIRYRVGPMTFDLFNTGVNFLKILQDDQRIFPVEMQSFTFQREVVLAEDGSTVNMDGVFVVPYDAFVVFETFNADKSWETSTGNPVSWFPQLDKNGSNIWSMAANSSDRGRRRLADLGQTTRIAVNAGDILTARLVTDSGTDNTSYPIKTAYYIGLIPLVGNSSSN